MECSAPLVVVYGDEPLNEGLVVRILHNAGYRAVIAHDEREAAAALAAKPALVIHDLPHEGVCEVMRREGPVDPSAVPVIYLTGDLTIDRWAGDRLLMAKPFRDDHLIDAVRAALGEAGR